MKGKDILKKQYNIDEEKFRNAIYDAQNQIVTLTNAIKKLKIKKKIFEKSLIEYKEMDLKEFKEKHPNLFKE